METTMQAITLKIELPAIDEQDFRDEVDQVQFSIYMVLGQLSELIEAIQENGDPMHWPEGTLVCASTQKPPTMMFEKSPTHWSLCSASPSTSVWPATMIPTMQNVFPKSQPCELLWVGGAQTAMGPAPSVSAIIPSFYSPSLGIATERRAAP